MARNFALALVFAALPLAACGGGGGGLAGSAANAPPVAATQTPLTLIPLTGASNQVSGDVDTYTNTVYLYPQVLRAYGGNPFPNYTFTLSLAGASPYILVDSNGLFHGNRNGSVFPNNGALTQNFNVLVSDGTRTATAPVTLTLSTCSSRFSDFNPCSYPALVQGGVATYGLVNGAVGQPYGSMLFALGGTPPYRFTSSGLPPGLSLDAASGTIYGTPSNAGTYSFTPTLTDSTGSSANCPCTKFTIQIQ